jgi:hypothetical protein
MPNHSGENQFSIFFLILQNYGIVQIARAYIDDIVIFSRILQKYIQHLYTLFRLFSEVCIYLNFDKTLLGFPFITLLKQKIDGLGISIIKEKIKAVSLL